MKKISTLMIMLLLIIATLSACEKPAKTTNVTTKTETTLSEIDTTKEETTLSGTEETTTLSGTENNSGKYKKGNWNGNIYTNEILGFTYELPNNWKSLSNDEVNSLVMLGGGSEEEKIEDEEDIIYDFTIMSNDINSTLQLVVADMSSLGEAASIMSAEIMATEYKSELESDEIDYKYSDNFNMTIAGQEYLAFFADDPNDNTSTWYITRNDGKYVITFVASINTNEAEEFKALMNEFKAI